jgi:hypothetical protein
MEFPPGRASAGLPEDRAALAQHLIRPRDFRMARAPTATDAGVPAASGLANG